MGINLQHLWLSSAQADLDKLKRVIDQRLDVLDDRASDVASRIGKGEDLSSPFKTWYEQYNRPKDITGQLTDLGGGNWKMVFTGYLMNQAITANLIKTVISASTDSATAAATILGRPSDNVQVRVTSLSGVDDGAPFEATVVAHGDSSLTADSTAIQWRIMGERVSDLTPAGDAYFVDRKPRSVGTQLLEMPMAIEKQRMNTKYEVVKDELGHQTNQLIDFMRRKQNEALLYMKPVRSGGNIVWSNAVADPTAIGLFEWPRILQSEHANTNVYVNGAAGPPTKTMIDNLARALMLEEFADYNTGDWALCCHPITHAYLHDFEISYRRKTADDTKAGFSIDTFGAKIGKEFPIISDQFMHEGDLALVNLANAQYGNYANDSFEKKVIETTNRTYKWLISWVIWGVQLRQARASIGYIYNLKTSYV